MFKKISIPQIFLAKILQRPAMNPDFLTFWFYLIFFNNLQPPYPMLPCCWEESVIACDFDFLFVFFSFCLFSYCIFLSFFIFSRLVFVFSLLFCIFILLFFLFCIFSRFVFSSHFFVLFPLCIFVLFFVFFLVLYFFSFCIVSFLYFCIFSRFVCVVSSGDPPGLCSSGIPLAAWSISLDLAKCVRLQGGRGAHREKKWKSLWTRFTLVFLLPVEGTISIFLQRVIMELQLAQFCEMIAIVVIVGSEKLAQKRARESNRSKTLHMFLINILRWGQCCMISDYCAP